MSETANTDQNEKAAKTRRKPRPESVLAPTFATARQMSSASRRQAQPSGGGLLQRQCSCGKHTIAGGICEECQQKGETVSNRSPFDDLGQVASPAIQTARDRTSRFNFSTIPARTHLPANGQSSHIAFNESASQYQAMNSAVVQRQEPEDEETVNNDTRPWDVPFDGGRAETYAEAIAGLDHIDSFIFFNSSSDMPKVWQEQLDGAKDACWDAAQELKGKFGLLDPRDTTMLELLSKLVTSTWDEAVKDTRKQVEAELHKIKSGYGLDSKIADLQEKLHFGFIEGADEENIKAIQDTLTAVKEYKEKVDKVIGWAKDAASTLKKAKALDFFKKLEEVSGKFGTVLEHAGQAAEAAKIVYNLATDKGASGDFAALNSFEAGLDAIDFGMGFVKSVPLFGQLWSSYYSPMTRECLRLLREIAKLVDKQNRDYALFKWMRDGDKARMADGSPKIPKGLESNFPGGQAVLSYMWHVCNGGGGTATGSVRSYFVDHADQFNAGVPDGGVKLRTEGTWDWWNPFSWGNDDKALNLDAFVAANKDMIWAMLYGSIPQNI
jgi:hypothetical protein